MVSGAKPALLICLLLLLLSLFVLALDAHHWKAMSDQNMRKFQNLAGGLGMGAVTAPAWSIFDFDPRLQPVDESTLRPFPGGYSYSPSGTSSVTRFGQILTKDMD